MAAWWPRGGCRLLPECCLDAGRALPGVLLEYCLGAGLVLLVRCCLGAALGATCASVLLAR
eukprot:9781480-Lingulodinium_polyedra.AAC.1